MSVGFIKERVVRAGIFQNRAQIQYFYGGVQPHIVHKLIRFGGCGMVLQPLRQVFWINLLFVRGYDKEVLDTLGRQFVPTIFQFRLPGLQLAKRQGRNSQEVVEHVFLQRI